MAHQGFYGANTNHGVKLRTHEVYLTPVWFHRGYVRMRSGDGVPTDLTPKQARHLAERLCYFADRAEEGE